MLNQHEKVLPRRRDYIVPLILLFVIAFCASWGLIDIVCRLVEWAY